MGLTLTGLWLQGDTGLSRLHTGLGPQDTLDIDTAAAAISLGTSACLRDPGPGGQARSGAGGGQAEALRMGCPPPTEALGKGGLAPGRRSPYCFL